MPMKTFLCIVLAALLIKPDAKALFGHTAAEKERRIATEQQLVRQEQTNGQLIHSNEALHVIISVLSACAVVALITGAAIGSRTRRDHETHL